MHWLNEPAHWSAAPGLLTITADAGTDFWRTTSYGYVRDNGHLYGEVLGGDFDLSMRLTGAYADQYDQAGAMVRVDERHWLKTGVEYFDGRARFSTVVTNDHSSWAVADLPAGSGELGLLLTRRGDAVEVRYAAAGASRSWPRWRTCRRERRWPAPCAPRPRAADSGPPSMTSPSPRADQRRGRPGRWR